MYQNFSEMFDKIQAWFHPDKKPESNNFFNLSYQGASQGDDVSSTTTADKSRAVVLQVASGYMNPT